MVYDLGSASYFETEVVDDFVQRRKRRTKRLARDADNALRESMRGRLRGSGNAGSNPGADEDDDDPPRVNDDPPRGGIISGASHFCFGSMETADVEALVQRALLREERRSDADKASRAAYFTELAERRKEKRAAGKKKNHHNADEKCRW